MQPPGGTSLAPVAPIGLVSRAPRLAPLWGPAAAPLPPSCVAAISFHHPGGPPSLWCGLQVVLVISPPNRTPQRTHNLGQVHADPGLASESTRLLAQRCNNNRPFMSSHVVPYMSSQVVPLLDTPAALSLLSGAGLLPADGSSSLSRAGLLPADGSSSFSRADLLPADGPSSLSRAGLLPADGLRHSSFSFPPLTPDCNWFSLASAPSMHGVKPPMLHLHPPITVHYSSFSFPPLTPDCNWFSLAPANGSPHRGWVLGGNKGALGALWGGLCSASTITPAISARCHQAVSRDASSRSRSPPRSPSAARATAGLL